MKKEMYLVANIQTSVDGDGCDHYCMDVCVLPKEKALSRISGKTYTLGNKTICLCEGKEGRCNYGAYGDCYLVVCPADNGFINGGEIAWFMDREYWAEHDAEKEIETMLKEMAEEELTDALIAGSEVEFPAKETSRRRKHIKGDNKAKRRLASIYPISTDSIRKTRNGAYIHKGNTYGWNREWKRSFTKQSREEGKREIRDYVPDEEIFDEVHIRTTIEEQIEEIESRLIDLACERRCVDNEMLHLEEERLRLILQLGDEPRHWSF